MKRLEKNIKLDYVYRFISSVDITSAIWVLYLSYKGFSLTQIGLVEGIFHVAKFMFEIPTGAIADIWGRKNSLIASRVLAFLSSLIMIFGNSFGEIALGSIISAASLSLNSGSEEALVYDSLKALGKEEEYIKVNGILNFLIEVAQILAVFIGGVLSDINFQLSYGVAAIISLASLLISLGFYESNKSNLNEKDIIKIHFKECFRIIKNEKRLMKIMIYFGILFSIDTTAHFYMQEYLSSMDFTRSEIAGIFVIKGILSAIGSKYAYMFHYKLGKKGVMKFVSIITGILLMVMYLKGVTAIISFVLMGAMIGAAYPLSSNYINELIPSEQRATLISIDSMLFSFLMIGLFPAVGFAAQHLSMGLTFMILGFILIVEVIAAFYYNRDSN